MILQDLSREARSTNAFGSNKKVIVRVVLPGPKLQCLLKVKDDLSKVLIFQLAILNAK